MKYRDFVRLLEEHGFRQTRQRGSHRRYEGLVAGQLRLVTVSCKPGDEVLPRTLASMIRQSGLPKRLFRS